VITSSITAFDIAGELARIDQFRWEGSRFGNRIHYSSGQGGQLGLEYPFPFVGRFIWTAPVALHRVSVKTGAGAGELVTSARGPVQITAGPEM